MANLNGKVIVIDGVEYRLTMVDDRKKAIISMDSPLGRMGQVFDRDEVRVEEGEHTIHGLKFNVEFVTEKELEEKLKTAIEIPEMLDIVDDVLGNLVP
jgi:hypothetical protein